VVDVFHGEEAVERAEETGAEGFGGSGVCADFMKSGGDVLLGEELLECSGQRAEGIV